VGVGGVGVGLGVSGTKGVSGSSLPEPPEQADKANVRTRHIAATVNILMIILLFIYLMPVPLLKEYTELYIISDIIPQKPQYIHSFISATTIERYLQVDRRCPAYRKIPPELDKLTGNMVESYQRLMSGE